ncbi:unnamed protein product [Protopolystoma xenopodis]|uniref:Uncharacterized protein n=1 Tax=Protopolystoma xenopodis TaxID=117903 RepID=A0A448WP35_9PLAT|nr:unnamed protein product [Protopolystoma xenopodis]
MREPGGSASLHQNTAARASTYTADSPNGPGGGSYVMHGAAAAYALASQLGTMSFDNTAVASQSQAGMPSNIIQPQYYHYLNQPPQQLQHGCNQTGLVFQVRRSGGGSQGRYDLQDKQLSHITFIVGILIGQTCACLYNRRYYLYPCRLCFCLCRNDALTLYFDYERLTFMLDMNSVDSTLLSINPKPILQKAWDNSLPSDNIKSLASVEDMVI